MLGSAWVIKRRAVGRAAVQGLEVASQTSSEGGNVSSRRKWGEERETLLPPLLQLLDHPRPLAPSRRTVELKRGICTRVRFPAQVHPRGDQCLLLPHIKLETERGDREGKRSILAPQLLDGALRGLGGGGRHGRDPAPQKS
eukprot:scaffold91472_cov31-Tisochrysis_lutea.AAC.10